MGLSTILSFGSFNAPSSSLYQWYPLVAFLILRRIRKPLKRWR